MIKPGFSFFTAGSCFAEEIANWMNQRFIKMEKFPFGTVYNPLSAAALLNRILEKEELTDSDCLKTSHGWGSLLCHSDKNKATQKEFLSSINDLIEKAARKLKSVDVMVITWGTAWIYEKKDSGEIVNNCHKLPGNQFIRRLASFDEMKRSFAPLAERLLEYNPKLSLILTLSPVRHLRDSAEENSLSKSRLRCLIDEIVSLNTERIYYFPSYEIMMDELRDYRWYADDMTHPSPQAVSYIMKRFAESMGSDSWLEYLAKAEKLKSLLDHRILSPETPEADAFIQKRKAEKQCFEKEFPFARIEE